jgi:hypothetical protein
MDPLDFSGLTDDQLVGLIRAALRECVARGDAVRAAAQAATVDEAERAQVAREAADREAAKIRARERERIAREAAEAVRRRHEAQEAESRRAESIREAEARRLREAEEARRKAEEARRQAAEAVRIAGEREALRKGWLARAAALTGRAPAEILISRAHTRHGWRVLVNEGSDPYAEKHLVDYYPGTAVISTTRALVGRKRDLIAFCAEFWAMNPEVETVYYGSEFTWEETDVA